MFKVVQRATNLKAVSGQKRIARLSNVSESYTKNKTRKWELNRGTAMQVDKQVWTLVIKDKMKGVKQSMWLELDEHHLAHNCTFRAVKAIYEFVASN